MTLYWCLLVERERGCLSKDTCNAYVSIGNHIQKYIRMYRQIRTNLHTYALKREVLYRKLSPRAPTKPSTRKQVGSTTNVVSNLDDVSMMM